MNKDLKILKIVGLLNKDSKIEKIVPRENLQNLKIFVQ